MMIRYLILFGLVLGVPWKFADKDADEVVWLPFFAVKGTVNATLIESYVHKYSMAAAQIGSSYSWLGKSFARSKEHTQRRSNLTKWACLCCKGPGSSGTVHYIADPWLVLWVSEFACPLTVGDQLCWQFQTNRTWQFKAEHSGCMCRVGGQIMW
jgi:hypothetical protein